MTIDWNALWVVGGTALGSLATYLKTRKPNQAKVDAAVSAAKAEGSIADAEGALYKRLREEIEALRGDIIHIRTEQAQTRKELDAERAHSRRQDNYIWLLIRMLREHNINPPPFEDGEPIKAGGTD